MNIETNVVIWQNSGPSGALSVHVLNVDGTNTFTYNATSSDIFIQIRQAGTYYLDNIRMYRTYQDTVFVGGFEMDVAYRYRFNSMERDNEIKGKGNSYDFGARMYDPRVGRWLSIDPMFSKQPGWSTYKAMLDNPIIYSDPDGRTEYLTIITYNEKTGETAIDSWMDYFNDMTDIGGIIIYGTASSGKDSPGSKTKGEIWGSFDFGAFSELMGLVTTAVKTRGENTLTPDFSGTKFAELMDKTKEVVEYNQQHKDSYCRDCKSTFDADGNVVQGDDSSKDTIRAKDHK